MSDEQATQRFEVQVTSDSHFSWIRTRMGLERTLMAWVRTAVALIGFGFTIVSFFQRLGDVEGIKAALRPQAPRQLGLALIGAGVGALVISVLQYRSLVRYLWSPQFRALAGIEQKPMRRVIWQTPLMAVTIALALIGACAFGAVFFRLV